MNSLDIFIQSYFSGFIHTTILGDILYIASCLFDGSLYFVTLVLAVSLLIFLVRNLKYTVFFVFTLFIGGFITFFLKYFFEVSRPEGGAIHYIGYSFPSYHATMATIFFSLLIYIFDDHFKKPWRSVFNICCVLGVFFVSFSRLYFGVHWLSDVLAGILLGIVVTLTMINLLGGRKNMHR